MLKYFSLILDLLEIEPKTDYLKLAQQIENNPNSKLFCYHRHGFIFDEFKNLLQQKISLEDFTKIGDIESSKNLYSHKNNNSMDFLKGLKNKTQKLEKNSIYIVDKLSWKLYHQENLSDNIFYC